MCENLVYSNVLLAYEHKAPYNESISFCYFLSVPLLEKARGELANLLDAGVKEVKNSEEWRREYMTLFMRDRENMKIGDYRRLVQQIRRKVDVMTHEEMADIYDTSISDVENIITAIKNNPDASDEDIASIIVEEG